MTLRTSTLLLLAFAATSATATERGFTARDLVVLDRASAPTLSPDGRWLVHALREADFEADSARTVLYARNLLTRDLRPPSRLTPEGMSVSSPSFAPDGETLYFLSAKSGSNQLWSMPVTGGEPVQVSDYPLGIGTYRLAPDGRQVAVSFEVFPDCTDLACTRDRLQETRDAKTSGQHYERLFVRHWDTFKDGRLNQLFVASLQDGRVSGEPRRIEFGGDVPSKPFGGSDDYVWAPDSASLVFSARVADGQEPWSTNFDLYHVPADVSAAPRNLTPDNPASDTGPVFSPDGSRLYYRAMRRPGFESDRYQITELDLGSGQRREIAADWDRSAYSLAVSEDGKTLYTVAFDLGQRPLFSVDVEHGTVMQLSGKGTVGGFDLAGDTLAFTREALDSPAEVFVARADGSAERQITTLNTERLEGVGFGEAEQFTFEGWNDQTVHAYVVKPWNYTEGERYPVAFIIHGGPQGSMGNSFHYRWNPQTYAGAGYAVVFVDFHGSAGYGQEFMDSISGDWGGKPLEDLQKGWAAALERYDFLDGDRACALGASYGGYMVNWIAGNWPDGFSCLVNHAGVFDLRSMYYATEELWFMEWEFGGPQFQVPSNYEVHNPVNFVGNWNTPMLVIHGQKDYRVLVEQGLATFTALQRQGIPSELLYYPDENHWILRPQNSVQWHDTVEAWMARWTGKGN